MLKKISYGMALSGLFFSLLSHAKSDNLACEKNANLMQEVTFTRLPTFSAEIKTFNVQSDIYTIHNNTRQTIALPEISLISTPMNTLPPGSAFIDPMVPNACGATLAPLASCNIRVVLFPVSRGTYSQYLHIKLNTRQCSLNSPVFLVSTTPIIEPLLPGVVLAASSFYSCLLTSASSVVNVGPSVVVGSVCSGTNVTGFSVYTTNPGPGLSFGIHQNDSTAQTDLADAANLNTVLRSFCPTFPLSGSISGSYTPGTYCFSGNVDLIGTVHLTGSGPFYFIVEQQLNIAPQAVIFLGNNLLASSVFFSSSGQTSIGDNSVFQGILINEQSSLAIGTGVTLVGAVKNLGTSITIGQVRASSPQA